MLFSHTRYHEPFIHDILSGAFMPLPNHDTIYKAPIKFVISAPLKLRQVHGLTFQPILYTVNSLLLGCLLFFDVHIQLYNKQQIKILKRYMGLHFPSKFPLFPFPTPNPSHCLMSSAFLSVSYQLSHSKQHFEAGFFYLAK